MNRKSMLTIGIATIWLAGFGGFAMSAQDKYTVKVPGGLAFSDFKGYEAWQTISTSRNERVVAVILGNPAMIAAYQAGIPANSKPFADSGGWGYAVFDYNAASDTFTPGTTAGSPPQGNDAKCGFACHTVATARDYVFTEYAKR